MPHAMPHSPATPYRRLRLAGAIVLAAGWIAAACIFLMASHGSNDTGASSYRVVDGQVYTVAPDASKRELQQIERMGGKTAVRMFEFEAWMGTLWQGKRLACVLALLSSVVAATLFYLAGLAAEALEA